MPEDEEKESKSILEAFKKIPPGEKYKLCDMGVECIFKLGEKASTKCGLYSAAASHLDKTSWCSCWMQIDGLRKMLVLKRYGIKIR